MSAAAKSLQSCPTLCDPIDGSPPGSPVPGILQARTLEWVAISFSNAWKWEVKGKSLSCVRLLATPWTAAHQAPPSMGFPRQESWSGVPSPSPPITLSKSSSFYMHLGSHPLKYCPTSVVPTFYIISSSLTGSGPPLNKHALLLPEFIENKTKSTYWLSFSILFLEFTA